MPYNLSSLWDAANQSVIPQAPVTAAQNWMTTPKLDESPLWAQAKGFGAGALQGLRDLATPMNLASVAVGAPQLGEAGEAIGSGVQAARAASPSIDLLGDLPAVRQVVPTGGAVDSYVNALQGQLAGVPKSKALQGLQSIYEQFPHDSQSIKDISNPAVQANIERMYQKAHPTFEAMKGAFSGPRTNP